MRVDPYAHAPRLPEGDGIDPGLLFASAGEDQQPVSATVSPVELEIGPGRGRFSVERLSVDGAVRIVGLEIRRKWATIVDERMAKRGLGARGRVFAEDAKLALPRFLPQTVRVAYLHFPDPWWKKRHNKRLVLGDELLEQLRRILVVGGELFIQTDVMERAEEYEKRVSGSPGFEPFEKSARIDDHPYVARSPRERKAIEHGLPVARLRYRCLGAP
jgi:tRNA (guanine-N7-)-methyltransferase